MSKEIPKMFYNYAQAAWKKDVDTAAKYLAQIYRSGVNSPFSTNITLHDMTKKTSPNFIQKMFKLKGYVQTLKKAEAMPEVQSAKKEFIDSIKQSYPHTAQLRQLLIYFNRFSVDKVLPKASEYIKTMIRNSVSDFYDADNLDALKKMWQEMAK